MSQHDADADPEQFDATDAEDAELLIADPDDYHESQRLKEIHDARQEVRRTITKVDTHATDAEHHNQSGHVAFAVATYIAELEPLIEATDYDDSLEKTNWDSLREYADFMGFDPEKDQRPAYNHHLVVFREANQFLAEVKPIVTEDDTSEWEI